MAGEVLGLVGGWVKGFTQTEVTNNKSVTLNLVVNKLCHIQERMGHLGKISKESKQSNFPPPPNPKKQIEKRIRARLSKP